MRDAASLLRAKAKNNPKIQIYIDRIRAGEITENAIKELNEPPWMKNAMVYMLQSGKSHTIEEIQALMQDGIVWFDSSDQTKYQCFRYLGPDTFIGDKFAASLTHGDLLLIKSTAEFNLRHAEKNFGSKDLKRILPSCERVDDMTVDEHKMQYRQDVRNRHNDSHLSEIGLDSDDRGLFKIRRH